LDTFSGNSFGSLICLHWEIFQVFRKIFPKFILEEESVAGVRLGQIVTKVIIGNIPWAGRK